MQEKCPTWELNEPKTSLTHMPHRHLPITCKRCHVVSRHLWERGAERPLHTLRASSSEVEPVLLGSLVWRSSPFSPFGPGRLLFFSKRNLHHDKKIQSFTACLCMAATQSHVYIQFWKHVRHDYKIARRCSFSGLHSSSYITQTTSPPWDPNVVSPFPPSPRQHILEGTLA